MLPDNANPIGVVTEVAIAARPAAAVLQARAKYAPILANPIVRTAISLSLGAVMLRNGVPGWTLASFALASIAGIAVSDKYTHKYPYRYFSYLIASHLKATAVTAALLWLVSLIAPFEGFAPTVWRTLLLIAVVDLLLSVPRRRLPSRAIGDHGIAPQQANAPPVDTAKRAETIRRSPAEIIADLPDDVRHAMAMLTGRSAGGVATAGEGQLPQSPVDVLAITTPLNDVRRINRFLLACTAKLNPGGYIVCAYRPLENERLSLPQSMAVFAWHRACPKLPIIERLYFTMTRGKNRRLSRAEVWGRLAFCGHKVIVEQDGPTTILVAMQHAPVVVNRRPSYYPVVGLTKVGLDGENLTTHKIRSMFPFSEFIQKQVFDSNGLAAAGKISNDFRVTSYGRYLRRYWLDELPQIFDWLHGDIKLVGMRATSHHFLGLYPREFVDLYVQVKPGLIPPLFNEKTAGFAEIVKVEQQYLQAYLQKPVKTDLVNLYRSIRDIALRGVRSN